MMEGILKHMIWLAWLLFCSVRYTYIATMVFERVISIKDIKLIFNWMSLIYEKLWVYTWGVEKKKITLLWWKSSATTDL